MTYLELFNQIMLANTLCCGHITKCESCPYFKKGNYCRNELRRDIIHFKNELRRLGEKEKENLIDEYVENDKTSCHISN